MLMCQIEHMRRGKNDLTTGLLLSMMAFFESNHLTRYKYVDGVSTLLFMAAT